MSEFHIIQATIEKAARRRRWQWVWTGFWAGVLAGSAIWLLALAVFKLAPIPESVLLGAGSAAVISILAGLIWGATRRVTLPETARWIDGKSHLQERFSTALEVANSKMDPHWARLVVADAAQSAQQVNPKELMPYRLPKAGRYAFLVVLLAGGLGLVPEYRTQTYVQKKKEAESIKDTGRELAALARRTLTQKPPVLETTRKSIETVEELGNHLAKAQLTRSEALKDLASATEKLKDQAKQLGQSPAMKALQKAAKSSSRGGAMGGEDLQKQIESLQKQLQNQTADSEALDKLKEELHKAQEAAADLMEKTGAEADSAKAALAESLSDLAKSAQDAGLSLPSLEEAIKALANSDVDQVLKDLNVAEIDLEKLQTMAKALEKLEMQLQQMGKDLAEQLQKGQIDAAQATLKKMAQDLKSAQVPPDKMEKILSDVSKALGPAGDYGKVADHLKEAAKQLSEKQSGQAADSLEMAAQELDKMKGEMIDAEGLLASLDALQRAQMAIANGQLWSAAKAMPAFAKGGTPGRGVGTWTEEDSWAYPEITERWDNSGVERPDMDGRGVSDRGDGALSDNLVSTKIKGQLNPNGPMPSITMKGVSIKGMSKVDYKEMVTGAQSDAQSALNQEQVPKAYQGAVRNYFDDLK